jgi:hypothetical protein
MTAEGWHVIGGDWIIWLHPASRRVVSLEGGFLWKNCVNIPAWRGSPSPDDEVLIVGCSYRDEGGYPTSGESVAVLEYGLAVKLARRIRADILAERPVRVAEQLTLDDALEGARS